MRKILLPLLFICVVFPILAKAEPVTDETLDKLLMLSGLPEQFADYPAAEKAAMEPFPAVKGATEIDVAVFEAYKSAIEEEIKPDFMLSVIREELKAAIQQSEAVKVIEWLESDLGKKFTMAEINATKNMMEDQPFMHIPEILQNTDNVEFAKSVNEAINGTEVFTKTMGIQLTTQMYFMETVKHPESVGGPEDFKKKLNLKSMVSEDMATQMAVLSFAYTYEGIDAEDKEKYLDYIV